MNSPISLQQICYQCLERHILTQCQKIDLKSDSGQNILKTQRQYLKQLPATMRTYLMNKLLKAILTSDKKIVSRKSCPCTMYVVEVLFHSSITDFTLEFSNFRSKRFLNNLFTMISNEGKNLESLTLNSSQYDKEFSSDNQMDCTILDSALKCTNKLYKLELHCICADDMLAVIGENCKMLNILDLHGSHKVTDKGIGQLVINVKCTTNVDEAVTAELLFKTMCHGSGSLWNLEGIPSPKVLRNSLPSIEKKYRLTEMWWNVPNIFPPLALRRSDPLEDRRNMKKTSYFYRVKSDLCNTLQIIGLSLTSVTHVGVLCVLGTIKSIEYIDHDLTDFFRQMTQYWDRSGNRGKGMSLPQVSLVSLYLSNACEPEIRTARDMCPNLKHFSSWNSKASILSMYALPDLISLTFTKNWESRPDSDFTIINYILAKGHNLTNLTLHCAQNSINLYVIMFSCPYLTALDLDFMHITWASIYYSTEYLLQPSLETVPMKYLQEIELKRNISQDCVVNLLSNSPQLKSLSIQRILGDTTNFLTVLSSLSLPPYLETFYVTFPSLLYRNLSHVKNFLTTHSQIRRIGKISCPLRELELSRVDLEVVNY